MKRYVLCAFIDYPVVASRLKRMDDDLELLFTYPENFVDQILENQNSSYVKENTFLFGDAHTATRAKDKLIQLGIDKADELQIESLEDLTSYSGKLELKEYCKSTIHCSGVTPYWPPIE